MVTMARAGGDHFALAGGADIDLAADRREDLRVAQLDLGLLGEGAGVLHLVAGLVHGAGGDRGEQLVGAGLAQRGLGGGDVLPGRVHSRFGGLQAGGGVVAGLLRS